MMRTAAIVLAIFVGSTAPSAAQSGIVEGDFVGCVTEDLLDEVLNAAANNDVRQINHLLGNGCFNLRGWEYSVAKRGFLKSTVRVYRSGTSFILWTITDAIR